MSVGTNLTLGRLMEVLEREAVRIKPENQAAELRDRLEIKGGYSRRPHDYLKEALFNLTKASNTGELEEEQAIRLLVAYEIIENVKCSI